MADAVKQSIGSSVGGAALPIVGAIGSQLAGGFINSLLSKKATDYQTAQQKELMGYQWNNFLSPSAQVGAYGKAGLNAGAMFGNNNNMTTGPAAGSVTAPTFGIGTTSMSDLANLLVGLANAKKAGAEVPKIGAETNKLMVEADAQKFELELRKTFGKAETVLALKNAYQQLRLAMQAEDTQSIEQAIKNWQKVKEEALAGESEANRKIAEKVLANKDTELKLTNKLTEEKAKTEKSAQSANYASAESSKAAASNYRAQARVNAVLADIQEATSVQQIDTQIQKLLADKFISKTDSEEAKQKLQAITNMRDDGAREKIDDLLQWLKARINIFK